MSSIVNIAQEAGVSVATVSRIINRKPGISKNTTMLVRNVMRSLNYVPRPQDSRPGPKSSINKKLRNKAIAFVVSSKAMDIHASHAPFYSEILNGAEAELARHGLTMVYTVISEHSNIPVCVENNKVDGLLLFHFVGDGKSKVSEDAVNVLKQFSAVTILGESISWCDHITYNNKKIGSEACKYIASRGHKYVALLDGLSDEMTIERCRSFELSAHRAGIKVYKLGTSGLGLESAKENEAEGILDSLIEELLRFSPFPASIYVPFGHHTKRLYRVLLKHGVTPGKDLEVVTVNKESPLLSGLEPRPAAVDLKADSIGRSAVKRLLWRIENPEDDYLTMLVEPVIVGPND